MLNSVVFQFYQQNSWMLGMYLQRHVELLLAAIYKGGVCLLRQLLLLVETATIRLLSSPL